MRDKLLHEDRDARSSSVQGPQEVVHVEAAEWGLDGQVWSVWTEEEHPPWAARWANLEWGRGQQPGRPAGANWCARGIRVHGGEGGKMKRQDVMVFKWVTMAVGSHDFGGWEIPCFAICKLENQQSVVPVRFQRPWKQEHWCLMARESRCFSSNRSQVHPSAFFFQSGPPWIAQGFPPVLPKVTQSTDSNLFQKYPHRYTHKCCFLSYSGIS